MSVLEEKIKLNQNLIANKFVKQSPQNSTDRNSTKIGFTDGWNKGWGNHGGPAKLEKGL